MSSKAKTLGAGRFGSSAAAPVSARRQAVAAATGVPTEGVAPPTQLPVDRISPNPDNPRSSLGDLGELAGSLKEHGQKQAITVMNRDAYLKANPTKAADLEPNATHVVIDGSSRLAAAREAGLTHIKVWVDDEQGADSEELLESALVANIHRNALPELDEARALQRLLGIHGSQAALAKRLHKSQGWVSQRLALLNLTPELQERIGEEPIKFLRAVGNKPQEEQAAALEEMKRKAAEEKAAAAERPSRAADEASGISTHPAEEGSGRHYPVIASAETTDGNVPGALAEQGGEGPTGHYPVMTPPAEQPDAGTASLGTETLREQPGSLPEPRTGPPEATQGARADDQERLQSQGPERQQPKPLPYDDPFYVAGHLRRRMQPQHRARLVRFLLDGLKEDSAEEYHEILGKAVDSAS
ncbi:ParB/RepB/Spo0J family partition protein [Streptomyces sp. MJP52]|uniref:ParB/RepB/Spo0J family partition protein n=1 Tax=Streptomyces sp. MJP52 TaxID=2940555 RepID=UPI00247556E1|nr:ParB/RepB/Spo0J family partition protein [Streptomyces sp. MJP52]MDH6229153.1 ParB family chromosome partitioning protein [Streptomyces sp. MJP52]